MIITVTPNPSIDRTLELPTLALGDVNRARAHHVEPSGKGVNVTRALAANGVRSTAVLPIGGAEGGQLRSLLDDEGVSYVAVPIAGSVRVNISIATRGGVVTKVNEPGPALSWGEAEALVEAVLATMGRNDRVVASGSLPGAVAADFYAELGARVRHAGGWFVLDTSGDALRRGLDGQPRLVKPNLDELTELARMPLPTLGDVIAAAEEVRGTTGGAVLVSLGSAGAVLVDGESPVHAEVRGPVLVRSSVGAGDNLLAGFLAGAGDRAACVREAVAWGTAAVRSQRSLARPITPDDRRSVVVHPRPDLSRAV
ncbi:1-phosphofructokinase family hexose kinase [Actinopolymorpha alba]|uniref:1-phosphofructokinase family hexose kinase n=1 Tax=Actinopolymorpha alba TaxID=533267 RepID=UPI00037E8529|nr:1-phosphofructokinase family hexose kinase [Actinopolymorpha alba]